MRKIIKALSVTLTLALVTVLLMSFSINQQKPKPWTIPAEYKSKKNPKAADDKQALNIGKMMYNKHCKSCHGTNGNNGPKAKNLKTFPGDFLSDEFKKHTDGELYYKSFVGRDEMPNFEKKIPSEDHRWSIIVYMRSMK